MSKDEIRREVLARRRAMALQDVAQKSAAILECLWALPEFDQASVVLTYVASKDNEVDTKPLIRLLLEQRRNVMVPIAEEGGALRWSALGVLEELVPSRFGILEPKAGSERPAEVAPGSVCLVPGVAFTRCGWRVGYGGGYFDRFLAGYDGLPIGLAFDLQLVMAFRMAPHDRPVQIVVTESATYRRGPG